MSGGKVATCSIGLTNLAETPLLASDAAKAVIGTSLDEASLKKAAAAAQAIMSPAADARDVTAESWWFFWPSWTRHPPQSVFTGHCNESGRHVIAEYGVKRQFFGTRRQDRWTLMS
jgi:CO dehydrogenase flavoprotein C-terminal domain